MGAQSESRHRKGWFWEYSRTACDELLSSPEIHEELVGLYPWCPNAPEEIHERSFPGYILLERLDDGTGLGIVFLAITDPAICPSDSRRPVCIKIPSLNRIVTQEELTHDTIHNEIQILRALESCPMLHGRRPRYLGCGTIDLGFSKPLPYVVTEYIAFLTPFQRYSRNGEIATWINISRAVNELHSMGIVHGDLYERNIFIDRNGQPVLLDFGAARRIRRLSLRFGRPPSSFPPDCHWLDEITIPNQRLSCAFDVACLAQTFQRVLSKRLTDDGECVTYKELRRLLGMCIRAEPEYRPQSAGELASLLHNIVEKRPAIVKPIPFALFNSLYRRYPTVVWPAFSMSCLLAILSIFLSLQWREELKQREKEQQYNQKLTVAVAAKEKALASMFLAMQAMLKSTIALDEAQVPTQSNGRSSRKNIAFELAKIINDKSVSEKARLSALQLLMDTARGHLEVDGVEFAQQCVEMAQEALTDQSGLSGFRSLEFQCLTAQVMVFDSAMEMRSLRPSKSRSQALQLARTAVDNYLAIRFDNRWTDEQRLLFLKTGIDVLRYGIYSFEASEWKDLRKDDESFNVFQHAMLPFDIGSQKSMSIRLSLARLNYIYALLIHKSYVPHTIKRGTKSQFVSVREHIALAKSLLNELVDNGAGDPVVDERELGELEASLSLLAGLSFMQTSEFSNARAELDNVLQYRKTQVLERPGSLLAIRQVISAAWTFSDTYFSEAHGSDEPQKLHMESIPSRQYAVDQCCRLYLASPDNEVKEDYIVNQMRLSFSQILCGREDEAIEGLRKAAERIELEDPGTQHTLGDDLYICLAFLHRAYPNEERYRELVKKQADILVRRLRDIQSNRNTFVLADQESRINDLLSLFKSPRFADLVSVTGWSEIIDVCEEPK